MPDDKDKKKPSKTTAAIDIIGETLKSLGDIFTPSSAPVQRSEARVGAAPQPLAGFSTAGAPSPMPQQAPVATAPGPPPVGALRTGTEFSTKAGGVGAMVASGVQNVAEAIHGFKAKRDQDNITKAQNWLNMYETAKSSGDEYTASLLANDPKVVKAWEKYLKMEFPRVEKLELPTSQRGAGGELTIPMKMGEQPRFGGEARIATPGPTPAAQLETAKTQIQLEGLRRGDPRMASAIFGPQAALSEDEFRQATRSQFGIELSRAQVAAMDEKAKELLTGLKADIVKEAVREAGAIHRAEVTGGFTVEAARIRAQAMKDSTAMRVGALKEIAKGKGADINEKIFINSTKIYKDLITNINNNLSKQANLSKADIAKLQADRDTYEQKLKSAQEEYEGYKLFRQFVGGEALKPEQDQDQP